MADKESHPHKSEDRVVVQTAPDTAAANKAIDKFQVRLNSYQLASALGVTAIHNEIAFYKNQELVLSFNGNAHDRETGKFEFFALEPNHTLRVTIDVQTLESANMKLVASRTMGEFYVDEFLEKLNAATAASNFINDNKIDYVIVGGPHFEAQNSNSVATSLLHAMGYEYPSKELDHLWAPGSKKILLPDDWSVDDAILSEMTKPTIKLESSSVARFIKDEKYVKPKTDSGLPNFPKLFNPNETTVAYTKKGDEIKRPPGTTAIDEVNTQANEVSSKDTQEECSKTGYFQSSANPLITADHNLTACFTNSAAHNPVTAPDMGSQIDLSEQKQKAATNATSYLDFGTHTP